MNKQLGETRKSNRMMRKFQPSNLTLEPNREHPLLNGLILENIFGYLKGQKSASTIGSYRVVCKIWDQEISKLIRKDTRTNLSRILAPYPAGFGWIATPDNTQKPFYYKAPILDLSPFENVSMNASLCTILKNQTYLDWFKIMGANVKSLRFSSPLTCSCQNQFLERILKEWCPNLGSLDLVRVENVNSLFVNSSFTQNSTGFIFKGLKELRLYVNGVISQKCPKHEDGVNSSNVKLSKIQQQEMKFLEMETGIIKWEQIRYMYDHGRKSGNSTAFPEIVTMPEGQLVTWPEGFVNRDMLQTIQKVFQKVIAGTDGGIIGQLMKVLDLEKFVFFGLNFESRSDLVTFFHFRPNKWRKSLKHLVLDASFSDSNYELHVLAQVKFPLTSIKFEGLHPSTNSAEVASLLLYFADTLEHLEYSGQSVRNADMTTTEQLELPALPKLKNFVHENITACALSAENLWNAASNLEKCSFRGCIFFSWDSNRFFGNTTATTSTAMRELKLLVPVSGNQVIMLLDWFPNLLKIEVILRSLEASACGFFGKLEKSKVTQLKLWIINYISEIGEAAIFWKAENIQGLQFLELVNMTGSPFHLTGRHFSMANLTSLKLINFRLVPMEEKKLLESLTHIPFVELINIGKIYL